MEIEQTKPTVSGWYFDIDSRTSACMHCGRELAVDVAEVASEGWRLLDHQLDCEEGRAARALVARRATARRSQ